MKRGNTALKRGVGLASAFALAIAGAVIAAPAANAAALGAADSIRTEPVADAAWVASDGSLRSVSVPYAPLNAYAGTSTGAVPTIVPGKTQDVSSAQVKLAIGSTGAFASSDTLALNLPTGVTFVGTPTVTLSAAIQLDDLAKVAGYNGNGGKATAATPAKDADSSTPATRVQKNVAKPFTVADANGTSALTITFNAADKNSASTVASDGTPGYVVTVSGIKVKAGTTAIAGAVTLGNATAKYTTVAYLQGASLTAQKDYTWANGGLIELDSVVLKDLTGAGLGAAAIPVTVSADPAGDPDDTEWNAAGTVTGGTAAINGSDATVLDVTPTAAATASVTVKSAKVAAVPFGSDIVLSLDAASTGDTSAFAHTADQAEGASATISSGSDGPRFAGKSRYETAGTLATAAFNTATSIILANGQSGLGKDGVDALAANFLAGVAVAPILLTDSGDSLDPATKDAIGALISGSADVTIYVMGGTDSVSDALAAQAKTVADALNGSGKVTVTRIAGTSRAATAALALKAAVDENPNALVTYNFGDGYAPTAILASGTTNADALAAAGVSFAAGVPVLLATDGAAALPKETSDALNTYGIKNIVILGGTDRVSAAVEASLKAAGVNVQRVEGKNRFDTSVKIAEFAAKSSGFNLGSLSGTVYVANGVQGWPDALAAGPLAGGSTFTPVLTVSVSDTLDPSVESYLKDNKDDITALYALGGIDRVTPKALTSALKAAGLV